LFRTSLFLPFFVAQYCIQKSAQRFANWSCSRPEVGSHLLLTLVRQKGRLNCPFCRSNYLPTRSSEDGSSSSYRNVFFLGAFAEFRKATFITSCLFARPPARLEQLGSHSKFLMQFYILRSFRKSVKRIQVPLKSDKNNRYFA
jgi:hypothetical protein